MLPESGGESATCRARISVERRSDPHRREGHVPPVIVEGEALTRSLVFDQLYEIANDNVAVARGLIQWQSKQRGK
ncbi:MAG TPA: hypothetical protein VIQ74_07385 [Gemmatimonadaceae bacterium]